MEESSPHIKIYKIDIDSDNEVSENQFKISQKESLDNYNYNSPQKLSRPNSQLSSCNKGSLSTSVGLSNFKDSNRFDNSYLNTPPKLSIKSLNFRDNKFSVAKKLNFDAPQLPMTKELIPENCVSAKEDKPAKVLQSIPTDSCKTLSPQNLAQKDRNKKECRFCQGYDETAFMVRPCLCKGTMQYIHQVCLQKDVEKNYMNESKERFIRDLSCQICRHPFKIQTFQSYSFSQSISPLNKRSFILYSTIFISALIVLMMLLYSVSITFQNQPYLSSYVFFLFIVGCLVSFGVIIKFLSSIICLMAKFEWMILDRNSEESEEKGQIVNQYALMGLIKYFNNRHIQNQNTLVENS